MNANPNPSLASALSLHRLTPDQALLAALRVKPADLKRLEEKEEEGEGAEG